VLVDSALCAVLIVCSLWHHRAHVDGDRVDETRVVLRRQQGEQKTASDWSDISRG